MRYSKVFCILFFMFVFTHAFAKDGTNDSIQNKCLCSTASINPALNTSANNSLQLRSTLNCCSSLSNSQDNISTLITTLNNAISIQNNNIDILAIIVTFFGIIIAVVGFFGYNGLKNEIKEYKDDITNSIKDKEKALQNKINEIDALKNSVGDETKRIEDILKSQLYQNLYLQEINKYLFLITNSLVDNNNNDPKSIQAIRESLYNKYHIIKLFLPWSEDITNGTKADFMYLQNRGTKENIEDLEIIANNDPDENKRKLALETIGHIRAKVTD